VGKARVLLLVKVPTERQEAFLQAYEKIRFVVAGDVPGHLMDQVCQSATDPEQWLITSEWRDLESFEAWERGQEHRNLVKPMRECFVEANSLRFVIRAETSASSTDNTAPASNTALKEAHHVHP